MRQLLKKNLDDRNLWTLLHTRIRKKSEQKEDEPTESDQAVQQKLPGFISNSAGTVYICPTEGCAKVFSNYQNFVAHIELDIHDKKKSQETLLDCARMKFRDLLEIKMCYNQSLN